MTVRTRFAPSPTGYLHIGGLRTALYAYLFARKHEGTLVLRVEDTDRSRFVPGAVEALIRALDRTGIHYDEGPILKDGTVVEKGDKGPYLQSQRLPLYQEQVQILVANGSAYYCFCTKERLETVRQQQEAAKMQTKYDRHCTALTKEEVEARLKAGEAYVIRMRVPDGETSFKDVVRGMVTFKNEEIDDQVLLKSDGYPTYHLANVVDDHFMEITHVIRAEEWLSSTPKHIILYRMFGWNMPEFAHLPLILNPDKSKLSKRQGDVAVEDYLAKGYLAEALVNFVALIGYNPRGDQEIYTVTELIESFELSKVNPSGGVFNREKLDWMNGQYIRMKTGEELASLVQSFLEQAGKSIDRELLIRICTIEKERLVKLTDIVEKIGPYVAVAEMDPAMLVWKKSDAADAKTQIEAVANVLETADEKTFSEIRLLEAAVKQYIESNGLQNGNVLWPVRVALSRQKASPSPFELAWALGKRETLARLQSASKLLS